MRQLSLVVFSFLLLLSGLHATVPSLPHTNRVPGVDLAEGVTELTGVAISPLLGVSAVGAWQYYKAPEGQRGKLPWYCHPFVWTTGFCILGLCLLKDVLGTGAPALLKKPFDVAELFESKASALVACSAFVPFVVSEMTRHTSQASASLPANMHLSSMLAISGFDSRFIAVPLAMIGFLVVWLAAHAINVMITLSPFVVVDATLKLFKAFLLSSVVLSSFISPWLGAIVSLGIVVIAALVAPWAFRLTVFGTLFGLDILMPGRGRRGATPTEPHAFLTRSLTNVPVRTYGRLIRSADGVATFRYRPWLVLPKRTLAIPSGNVCIAKGLLYPSLLHSADDQQRHRSLVMFLPRYRSHEPMIGAHFEITDIRDSPLIRGFRAVRNWFADTINLGRSKFAEVRGIQ